MRIGRAVLLSGLAWFLFAVGLVSPLTPSEGSPGPMAIVAFVGGPLGVFASIGLSGGDRVIRALGWLQLAAIVCIAWLVLSVVVRT